MTLNLTMPTHEELKPRITVFGVGGAGGNAVDNMIEKKLEGVEFVVANTDAQALQQNHASTKIQMGVRVTEGLGAGARPSVGAAAAEETIEEIVDHLAGAHMCFITAGMGGGTGTGAAPIIAQAARELGVLTVGVVTKPFQFEGAKRMRQAEEGVQALQKMVDTLIIIPNQNLFRIANEKTTFSEAFSMADEVLHQGVKGVTDLMVRPGLINLDFADVRAVMDELGKAMMGTGEAEGEDRAIQAAEKAIANPLLDEISLKGAKGVLINITGSDDLTLFELDEAANRIREEVDADANIIVGSTLDTSMEGTMRVSVVATGIDAEARTETPPARGTRTEAVAAPAPVAAPVEPAAPVYQEPAVAEAPAAPVQPEPQPQLEEPSLFEGMGAPAAPQTDDGLPPPAYQPEPQQPQQAAAAAAPRAAGQPTAEALARLERVTGRAPGSMSNHVPGEARYAAGLQQPDAAPAVPGPERPRFGINTLITRMAGGVANADDAAEPEAPRQQPSLGRAVGAAEPQLSEDQERIEIPAFLRRQAN
ncbi:MAG: cell division protein FtsZ [Silicimonas sp.]|nr:cell division protein FtsZ [Silicimonas sp.]